MLFVEVGDPELSTVGDRVFYRGEPFSGEITESLPDLTEIEAISYENGCRQGSCFGWYPNGTKRYSGVFGNGRRVDVWRHWSEEGKLVREEEFDPSGGLRHSRRWDEAGALVEDFDAAALAKPVVWQAVVRNDPDLEFDVIANAMRYRGRPFTGQTVTYFHEGGPVVHLEWFVDGYSDGPELGWHGDGARHFAGLVARNRPVGLWLYWYQDGTVRRESVFDAGGSLRLRQEWNEAGELVARGADLREPADELPRVATTDDELVRDEVTGRLDHRGTPFTGRLETRTDGILVRFQDYRDGYPDGLSVEFDDGRLRRRGVADANGPVGCWYEYRPDGRISREQCYDNRNRLLLDRHWDEVGALERPAAGLALLDNGTARRGEIGATDPSGAPHGRQQPPVADPIQRPSEQGTGGRVTPWRVRSTDDVLDLATRMRTLNWSWQMADAPEIAAAFGWHTVSNRARRVILDTGLGLDSGNIQAKDGRVVRIEVQVTGYADADPASRARVREAFEAMVEAMSGKFGVPTAQQLEPHAQARWAGPEATILLNRLEASVWLVLVTNERLAMDDRNLELQQEGLL